MKGANFFSRRIRIDKKISEQLEPYYYVIRVTIK